MKIHKTNRRVCRFYGINIPFGGGYCQGKNERNVKCFCVKIIVTGRLILCTTSPSPSVTPLLVGEALALRKLHLFASGSPTREAGGRKPDGEVVRRKICPLRTGCLRGRLRGGPRLSGELALLTERVTPPSDQSWGYTLLWHCSSAACSRPKGRGPWRS